MTYVPEYWKDNKKRIVKAKKHTTEMEEKYGEKIKECIKKTKMYGDDFTLDNHNSSGITYNGLLSDLDSVSAIFEHTKERTAVLNFASYKHPGGCFMDGSMAQEECLCHSSFLYNVLKEFPDYYKHNCKNLKKSLYTNRALYSPDVIFENNGGLISCDVITCASPNKSAAQKYCNVSNEENMEALKSRIKFLLDVAEDNSVNTLILGAYGAGVFGQSPTEVASVFVETLKNYDYHFANIIFAIPKGRNGNFECFKNVLLRK